jgi:hypothetical protein
MTCTGCPTCYRTRHFFNNSNTNEYIATKQTHTTDTFLFISHTTNVLLFKFRCNIFIGVRIIKEMPGTVASGTFCIIIGFLRRETVGLFTRSYVCNMALIEPFSSYSVDVKHHRIYTKKVVKSYLQYLPLYCRIIRPTYSFPAIQTWLLTCSQIRERPLQFHQSLNFVFLV